MRRAILAALLLAAPGACTRGPTAVDSPGNRLGVFSVLRAGSDSAAVLVVRYRPTVTSFEPSFDPVPGADVRLSGPGGEVRLAAGADACLAPQVPGTRAVDAAAGCYAARLPQPLAPGAAYELRVTLPGGGEVRGHTAVPGHPQVLAPTAGARVASAPGTGEYAFLLRYQAGADAGMVTLAVLGSPGCTVDLADESAAAGASFEVGGPGLDSAMVRLRGAVCRSGNTVTQPDSAPATLHLTALDTAYSRFRRETDERGSLLESRASAGLSGAVGFFGAAAATQVPIVLVRTR